MMDYNYDLFILGKDIESPVGKVRFLSFEEYIKNMSSLSILACNVLHFYWLYKKVIDVDDKETLKNLELIKKESLYNIVVSDINLLQSYLEIFKIVLVDESEFQEENEDLSVEGKIDFIMKNPDLFMHMRELILKMNLISEEKVSENPLLQRFLEKDRKNKQKDGGTDYTTILSTLFIQTGIPYSELVNSTVLQIISGYNRYGQIKNYETSSLFKTVSNEVEMQNWDKNIDLFNRTPDGMSLNEFNEKYKKKLF